MQKRFVQQVQTQFWCAVSQPVGILSAGLMLGSITGATIALTVPIAQAASLDWQYDPGSAALSLNLPAGSTPRYFLAAQPARIVVDLPNTDVGTVQTEKQFPGAVQQIRIAQFQPGITRIVMQLAPGTVLAPQQVELQQNGDRWILRPILANGEVTPVQPIAAVNPLPQTSVAPSTNATPATPVNPATATPPATPPANAAPEPLAGNQSASDLPPLEPGATEIPVELPPSESTPAAAPTVTVPALAAVATNPAPAVPSIADSAAPPAIPAPQASAVQTPDPQAEPPTPAQNPAEATPATLSEELPPAEPNTLPTELPPAIATPALENPTESTVSVPALEPSRPSNPSPSRTREITAIEFGQPLPGAEEAIAAPQTASTLPEPSSETDETIVAVNSSAGVLLPAGTVLPLRYQGEETLNLTSDYPLQEVLVVDRDVQDQNGQIIVPAGSQVIGRFETGSAGSEFIAQAIVIDGENILLNGRSDQLSEGRQVSGNRMMQNSAIGAVAGTLLGAVTGVGLIAGIAAGAATSAATTYLASPQPAMIEPDRIVEVRLLEDLRQPGSGIGG